MCAYRLANLSDPTLQDSVDDREYGGGTSILRVLNKWNELNKSVFVVTIFGGRLMGKDRYECIEKVANEALDSNDMPQELWTPPVLRYRSTKDVRGRGRGRGRGRPRKFKYGGGRGSATTPRSMLAAMDAAKDSDVCINSDQSQEAETELMPRKG